MRVPDCSMDVLAALVAAGESRTKAEAAATLKISISAFDKRLRTASSLYGAPLVEQSDNELRLTEEGQIYYTAACRSVEFASLAEESVRARLLLRMSSVLIGHSSYLAPGMLAMVHGLRFEAHPRVLVKHRAALTRQIVREVRDGQMLAGFGFLPLSAPELVIRNIWDEPLVVCIPSSHPIAARAVIRPEDLDGLAVIAVARDPMPGMHKEIEDYFASVGVKWSVVADAFAPTEALHLVAQQVGVCILAGSSALPHRGVTVRPLWTRALRRASAFFYREDDRSALMTELNTIVFERGEELRRVERNIGKRRG